ncbi:cold shock DNA-binding protein [Shigella flexneri]|nr:cold shock DNA-binding protein [Shigella flexneri]SVH13060.1 cold shock DNA-binding protein [Shigella flexneri]
MSRKMTGIVKTFDRKSGKGFIIPSDGRKEVQVHISAFTPRDAEVLIPGLRVEFCRVNGLRGPTAANVYLSRCLFKADWFYWNSSIVNTIHYNISYFSTKKLIHLSEYLCT